MAEQLGQLDLVVQTDDRQIRDSFTKGGQSAGRQISGGFQDFLRNTGALRSVAGGSIGGLAAVGGGAAASGGLAALGPFGIAAAGVTAALLAAITVVRKSVRTVKGWDKELEQAQRRLAPFSSALLGAEVGAIRGQLRRDIRSAARLGPSLAAAATQRERFLDLVAPTRDLVTFLKSQVVEGSLRRINDTIQKAGLDQAAGISGLAALATTINPVLGVIVSRLGVTARALEQQAIQAGGNEIYFRDLNQLTGGFFVPQPGGRLGFRQVTPPGAVP